MGLNAHHKNGISEIIVSSLSELSRAMMIHSKKRWTSTITANQPYAINMSTESLNEIPSLQDSIHITPSQTNSGSKVMPSSKHWNTFGFPVYALVGTL